MSSLGSLSTTLSRLTALREKLDQARSQVRVRLERHASGLQAASWFATQIENLLRQIWDEAIAAYPESFRDSLTGSICLVLVGGTGRGDPAPYSDVDLLILHSTAGGDRWHDFAAQFVRNCWDSGMKLGQSTRSVPDAIRMAREDIQFATSLFESRYLVGATSLFDELIHQIDRKVIRGRVHVLMSAAVQAREQEQAEHGTTNRELEPNVKTSGGGLRDVHLLRWFSRVRCGNSELESLRMNGLISRDDLMALMQAYEFLTWIRLDLHLDAHRADDVLNRAAQVRLAERRGFETAAGQLAVERFMREYFRLTSVVQDLTIRLVRRPAGTRWQDLLWRPVLTHRVDTIYRISPDQIQVPPRHRGKIATLEDVLRLYWSAAMYSVPLAPDLEEDVRLRVAQFPEGLSAEGSRLFMDLLARATNVGPLLRSMYRTGTLEMVLPCFRHIRCLLQFNQYHHYTVDEHTLRAVEAAESLMAQSSLAGTAFREIRHRDVLYLAILLHDAGKGFEEDHSEVGRRLAIEVAQRLRLSQYQREAVIFLVHKHLMMAHLAFRRDTSDPVVLVRFSHEAGTVDRLRMLYILTVADITAVGPGVWTDWKAELLGNLYVGAHQVLSGTSDVLQASELESQVMARVVDTLSQPTTGDEQKRLQRQIHSLFMTLPRNYVQANSAEQICADLRSVLDRGPDEITVSGRYLAESDTVEFRIIADEKIAPGCFHKITGVLTALRTEILSAQIATTSDGIIIDSFHVFDPDHAKEVPEFRIDEIRTAILDVLRKKKDVEALIKSRRRSLYAPQPATPLNDLPVQVLIDNDSSDQCTVLDVFAHDFPGLLYGISHALFEMGVSIALAKISTHLDQVVDVFYVTDAAGKKVLDAAFLEKIQTGVLEQLALPQTTT